MCVYFVLILCTTYVFIIVTQWGGPDEIEA